MPTSHVVPPRTASVRDVLAALKKDADAGVPEAACRVGAELARCQQAKQVLASMDRQLATLARMPASPALERQQAMTRAGAERYEEYAEACAGIDDATEGAAWRYLFRAAQAGSVSAMAQFAVNPPLSREDIERDLEGWAAYRQYGPGFLEAAVRAGDVRALYTAMFSAGAGMSPTGARVTPDPYRAIVYGTAALPIVDSESQRMIRNFMPRLQAQVGQEQADLARREGEELRRRSFASSPNTLVSSYMGEPRPMECHGVR
ncbi:hypothetical protein BWI17_02200 [Betaproteobacteria bacterium GR16-43]|nr:hypothetical protein BWI17_02200 [Betaproteobacteria bacterium GR16-43]